MTDTDDDWFDDGGFDDIEEIETVAGLPYAPDRGRIVIAPSVN